MHLCLWQHLHLRHVSLQSLGHVLDHSLDHRRAAAVLGAPAPCRGKVSPRSWDWESCRFTMTVGSAETHRNNLSLSCRTRKQLPPKTPHCTHRGRSPPYREPSLALSTLPLRPIWSPALRLCPAGGEKTLAGKAWQLGLL